MDNEFPFVLRHDQPQEIIDRELYHKEQFQYGKCCLTKNVRNPKNPQKTTRTYSPPV